MAEIINLTKGNESGIELLQDLDFPVFSNRIKYTRNGEYLFASGGYPPVIREGVHSMRFTDDGFTFGVGTGDGSVVLYDIRSAGVLAEKSHFSAEPVIDIKFVNSLSGPVGDSSKYTKIQGKHNTICLSCTKSNIRVWDTQSTNTLATVIPSDDAFSVCARSNSGLLFVPTRSPNINVFYLPILGMAPSWAYNIDVLGGTRKGGLTALPVNESIQTQHDERIFVTKEDLENAGLLNLVGTEMVKAYMHGFYIRRELWDDKAKKDEAPVEVEDKRSTKNAESRITKRHKVPIAGINADLLQKIEDAKQHKDIPEERGERKKKDKLKAKAVASLETDNRFASLFTDTRFEIDKTSDEYKALHPMEAKGMKQQAEEMDGEEEVVEEEEEEEDEDEGDSDDGEEMMVEQFEEEEEEEEGGEKWGFRTAGDGSGDEDEDDEEVDQEEITDSSNSELDQADSEEDESEDEEEEEEEPTPQLTKKQLKRKEKLSRRMNNDSSDDDDGILMKGHNLFGQSNALKQAEERGQSLTSYLKHMNSLTMEEKFKQGGERRAWEDGRIHKIEQSSFDQIGEATFTVVPDEKGQVDENFDLEIEEDRPKKKKRTSSEKDQPDRKRRDIKSLKLPHKKPLTAIRHKRKR
ncbi:putative Nucleolar protein 10 [Blattamonas nauphoetae]|uniref:Nucleolar protein 10 n=1 Tax=Blattamonas nauphoetae TaxID=2049346 RepID=A0ABQ9Y9F8_9EUKA|nr:putative Nucleolar protein 10 [Blattamonas nauphoetae]